MLLKPLLFLSFNFYMITIVQSDCTIATTCSQCVLSGEDCIWCQSENNCQPLVSTEVSSILCQDQSFITTSSQCPSEVRPLENDKLQEMLDILHKMKLQQGVVPAEQNTVQLQPELNTELKKDTATEMQQEASSSTTSSKDLKELLHKLLLLKLLRKVKTEGSATLTEEDKKLLSELSLNVPTPSTTTTTTTTTKSPITPADVNNELSQLIEILKNEAEQKEKQVTNEIANEIKLKSNLTSGVSETPVSPVDRKPVESKPATSAPKTTAKVITKTTKKLLKMTLNAHEENGGVDYVNLPQEKLNVAQHKTHNRTLVVTHYCNLYEDSVLCNKDHNCTWCNSVDECIHRNDQAFDTCVHAQRKGYNIDPCFSSKHCKQCVQDVKCYWCDVSKSCHTYPFFGYVPDACGGDWYVKQCDVQLAVIIIVLPLIMILLAMITFYFCLKYCYYRKKVLRVPLFEKPGVFDYRKDKKVYFVHPDDEEDSDNELEAEKLRKKYRLPAERAPLIDPNS